MIANFDKLLVVYATNANISQDATNRKNY